MSDQPLGSNVDVSNSGQTGESSPSPQPQSSDSGQSGNGINPAWNPLLEALPTNLHAIATPHLRQWDQNFQQRLQQEQQVYAPYKQFIDQKVDPQMIAGAMQLMQLIDQDPRAFYDKMGEYYAEQWGTGQDGADGEEDDYSLDEGDENYQDPRFDQIKQQQDVIAQVLYQQMTEKQQAQQQEQQQQFDKQLEDEIGTIRTKYGEAFNEQALEMALSIALNSGAENLVEAADKVMSFRGTPQGQSAPTVLPTSGGLPSTAVNPGQLSRKDTRALVEQRFKAAFGGNQ